MDPKMSKIAERFPTLKGAPGVRPFSPSELDEWAHSLDGGNDESARMAAHAARFMVTLYKPGSSWRVGRFDLVQAYIDWDSAHWTAFTTWASKPYDPYGKYNAFPQ